MSGGRASSMAMAPSDKKVDEVRFPLSLSKRVSESFGIFRGNFEEKAAGTLHPVDAPQEALAYVAEVEEFFGTRHAHVAQAAFFFQGRLVISGVCVGEEIFFQSDQEYRIEFEAFAVMDRHQMDSFIFIAHFIEGGFKGKFLQEPLEGGIFR